MFVGKLNEDFLPILFRSEPSQQDRDVGFRLLNVKRTDLCAVLLKAGSKAREVLSSEIFEALANPSVTNWEEDCEVKPILSEGKVLVKRVQEIESDLRKIVDGLYPNFPGSTTLEVAKNLFNYYRIQLSRKKDVIPKETMDCLEAKILDYEKTKGASDAFCKSDQLFQCYIRDGLGKRMKLGCDSALFFAQETGINLRIWSPVNNKNDLLIPESRSRQLTKPFSPIIDLLWHGDKSHFDKLHPQPLQLPSADQSLPQNSSNNTAVRAVQSLGNVEGAPSFLIQNLAYRLLFSPLVACRRNAARHLEANLNDSEFLTNILLIALNDSDSIVLQLVDKMLSKLRFDRHKQEKPISLLIAYVDYGIDRNRQGIVIYDHLKGMVVTLDHLHKYIPPYANEVALIADSPLPSLNDYSPYITKTKRQQGENGVTLTEGFTQGNLHLSIGGTTSGAFNNPAGDVPRQSSASAVSTQPSASANPSEIRAKNFISSINNFLNEKTPDKKKLATMATVFWPKVQNDPLSVQKAKELYADLLPEIKQKFEYLYPAIHNKLI